MKGEYFFWFVCPCQFVDCFPQFAVIPNLHVMMVHVFVMIMFVTFIMIAPMAKMNGTAHQLR